MQSIREIPAQPLWADGAPQQRPDDSAEPTIAGWLPACENPAAAVVVCPGGGYVGRAEHEGEPIARWLAGLGIAGFVVSYRVAPYRWPVPQLDARRAIRTVRHYAGEWNVDPGRVGVLGFSAGGHLAASVSVLEDGMFGEKPSDAIDAEPARPDALVACYAVLDLDHARNGGSALNLLGDPPDPAMLRELSLQHRVTAATPPTFLWCTADDASVPVTNSLWFAEALAACGVPFALHVWPHGPHGLGMKDHPVGRAWPGVCEQWLAELGWTARQE